MMFDNPRRNRKIRRTMRRLLKKQASVVFAIALEIRSTVAGHTKICAVVHRRVETTMKPGPTSPAGVGGCLPTNVVIAMN